MSSSFLRFRQPWAISSLLLFSGLVFSDKISPSSKIKSLTSFHPEGVSNISSAWNALSLSSWYISACILLWIPYLTAISLGLSRIMGISKSGTAMFSGLTGSTPISRNTLSPVALLTLLHLSIYLDPCPLVLGALSLPRGIASTHPGLPASLPWDDLPFWFPPVTERSAWIPGKALPKTISVCG